MQASRPNPTKTIIRVTAGNMLEVYDLLVFGFYAREIGQTFFPSTDPYASLLASLATFGVGYLMRPIGAVFLGTYVDKVGRRKGLLVTLALMSAGTLTVALTPGYASIGLLAPTLILLGRLLQGFSAGAEQGSVSVYLAEIAPPGRTGFYVSWQSASTQISAVLAAVLGVALNTLLTADQLLAWGWRVPMLVGCAIIPLLFVLRSSLPETVAFLAHKPARLAEVMRSMAVNWVVMLLGAVLALMTTVSFYMLNAYTPTFGRDVLHLSRLDSLLVTFCVAGANFIWLPLGGALSDRIGRLPLLIVCTAGAVLTAYPAMLWLVDSPSFGRLLLVELWLSVLYGFFNGAMIVFLAELMPRAARIGGFSLAYSLAATLGGFTPAIATWLIHATADRAIPGAWLSFAAFVALLAALALRRRHAAAKALLDADIALNALGQQSDDGASPPQLAQPV